MGARQEVVLRRELLDRFGIRHVTVGRVEHGRGCIGGDDSVAGLDQVAGQEAAPTSQLEYNALVCQHRLKEPEDAGRPPRGMEAKAEMMSPGQVSR